MACLNFDDSITVEPTDSEVEDTPSQPKQPCLKQRTVSQDPFRCLQGFYRGREGGVQRSTTVSRKFACDPL